MLGSLSTLPLVVVLAAPPVTVDVQGHRGARAVLPENTLAGFRYAIEQGVDTLELDVQITRDDVAIVAHDAVVPGWCNARVGERWRTLTLADVKKLDCGSVTNERFPRQRAVAGEGVPTLLDVLMLGKTHAKLRFNVETKSVPVVSDPLPEKFAQLVVKDVVDAGVARRTTIQSFDHRTLRAARKLSKEVRIAALLEECLPDVVAVARAAGADILSPNHNWITRDDVAAAHGAGIQVIVWTVNEPSEWERALALGVDGLITDDPAALIAWLKSKGLRGH